MIDIDFVCQLFDKEGQKPNNSNDSIRLRLIWRFNSNDLADILLTSSVKHTQYEKNKIKKIKKNYFLDWICIRKTID